jgi:large subunit ribosomal protein L23
MSKHSHYDVIRNPVVTEKSTMSSEHGQVIFDVAPDATKTDIKAAVEALFSVTVKAVNPLVRKGKVKRFRGHLGVRKDVKKAIVTLVDGQTIDIATGI